MAYTPTLNAFDSRALIDNILGAVETNQEDALVWAVGDQDAPPPIAKFYNNAAGRLTTVFPVLMVTNHSLAVQSEDTLNAAVSVDLELMVSGGSPEQVTERSLIYAYVIQSILTNTKTKLLAEGSAVPFNGTLDSLETEFSVLRGLNGSASAFFQITQFRAIYIIPASAYSTGV